jgi:hypothetical protein
MSTTPAIEQIEEKAVAKQPSVKHQPTSKSSWRIADLTVLGVWILVTTFTLIHHEKWADEAQAWLLARDLDLPTLWFKELRYEGTPGLWHSILWLAQHILHIPYSGLGAIGLLLATVGVAFMLLRAPFPAYVRYLLAFSYFMLYQYAVIARPYVLLPLLAFAAALLFKDAKHPERITIVLVLLANLTLHGVLLTACIGLAFLWQAKRLWAGLDEPVRGRYVLCTGALLLVLFFVFAVINPPPDVSALNTVQAKTLSVIVPEAWQGINGAFFDWTPLTLAWLALMGGWCFMRKDANGLLLPIMVLVLGGFFGFYGAPHHQGTMFIAAITGFWIAWPTKREEKTFSVHARWTHQALVVGLVCLLGYQTWNAVVVVGNEYRYPYSGAEDAVKYLKSVGADHLSVNGYLLGMSAVQAQFDHNILANRPAAYFHLGGPAELNLDQDIKTYAADYVVFPVWDDWQAAKAGMFDPDMQASGYSLVHVSNGYLSFKRSEDIKEVYLIYHRNQ